ncbi:MAG: hypothetical protein RLZZ303_633 [Candidatus Hydrogenedentota bacterium]|jgi:hypothetical protein
MHGTGLLARETRSRIGGAVEYLHGAPEESGVAEWRDVSRCGASISLGRFLRPGRELVLSAPSPLYPGRALRLRARVMWCAPSEAVGRFTAGLLVYRDSPEAALEFATLAHKARGAKSGLVNKPVWRLYPPCTESMEQAGLAHAKAV